MKKNRLKKLHFLKIVVMRCGMNKNVWLLGLFMMFSFWNYASAQTKNVTLNVKDMPLREVFKEVKEQTGVKFIYSEIEIQKSSNVTLKFEKLPLETALERIFNGSDTALAANGTDSAWEFTAYDASGKKLDKFQTVVNGTKINGKNALNFEICSDMHSTSHQDDKGAGY